MIDLNSYLQGTPFVGIFNDLERDDLIGAGRYIEEYLKIANHYNIKHIKEIIPYLLIHYFNLDKLKTKCVLKIIPKMNDDQDDEDYWDELVSLGLVTNTFYHQSKEYHILNLFYQEIYLKDRKLIEEKLKEYDYLDKCDASNRMSLYYIITKQKYPPALDDLVFMLGLSNYLEKYAQQIS